MNFSHATCILSEKLTKEQPVVFNSFWVQKEIPKVYGYFRKHVRTEWGSINWDKIIVALDQTFQRRWLGEYYMSKRRRKPVNIYRNKVEVDSILKRYENKLYTFLGTIDEQDKQIRDTISTALVRIAQKGNVVAKEELVSLAEYLVNDWIESSSRLSRWKGHTAEALQQLEFCINRYRYPSTFIGYVFRTLEFVGMGLPPTYSLDEDLPNSDGRKRIDFVIQDPETREIYCLKR